MVESKEILLSKRKTLILMIGALLFILLGAWFSLEPSRFVGGMFRQELLIRVVGVACLLFFGFALVQAIRQFIRPKAGLRFSADGIDIDLGNNFRGLIEWRQIAGFSETQVSGQHLIMINLENPDAFIEKETSKFRKKIMKFSNETYGSPIAISATGLRTTHEELLQTVREYFIRFK